MALAEDDDLMRQDAVSGVASILEKEGAGTEAFPSECWTSIFGWTRTLLAILYPRLLARSNQPLSKNNDKADAHKRHRAKPLYSIRCSGLSVGSIYQAHGRTTIVS